MANIKSAKKELRLIRLRLWLISQEELILKLF